MSIFSKSVLNINLVCIIVDMSVFILCIDITNFRYSPSSDFSYTLSTDFTNPLSSSNTSLKICSIVLINIIIY